jgi:hypothetical protein
MSRHTIPAKTPGLTVAVGWDNPLQTYFAQVSRDDVGEDEDPVIIWLGGEPREVCSPGNLAEPLAPYAIISDAMIDQLRADRAACLDRAPTPLQQHALNVIRRSR